MLKFLETIKRPDPVLVQGPRLLLRYLARRDLRRVRSWFLDPEIVSLAFGVSADEAVLRRIAEDYFKEIYLWQKNILAIDTHQGETIGFTKFTVRREDECVAKVGIMIGERSCWAAGLGTEAMHLLLSHLFRSQRVDRIELDTAEFNTRAQRCFEKVGFVRMGNFTEINFLDGRASTKIWMSLEKEDYLPALRAEKQLT
ncbi:MAG TPA: GNAT family N-acetyltransferase [Candidatus Xenobia bacterium]|jgi:RimJ/RimL family protein N-acetyltransferase